MNLIVPGFWQGLKAWWAGRRDGKLGIPSLNDTTISHSEKQIRHGFVAGAENIKKDFLKTETNLSSQTKRLLDQVSQREKQAGEAKNIILNIGRENTDATIHPLTYYGLTFLLLILDTFINQKMFDFYDTVIFSYACGLLLSLYLIVMAHGLGLMIRRKKDPLLQRIFIGIFIFSLFVISIVRAHVSTLSSADQGGPSLGLGFTIPLFLVVNLMSFAATVFLSKESHDSEPLFNKTSDRLKLLSKEIEEEKNALAEIHAQRKLNKETATGNLKIWNSVYQNTVAIYRNANIRKRTAQNRSISIFNTEPTLPEIDIQYLPPYPEEENVEENTGSVYLLRKSS